MLEALTKFGGVTALTIGVFYLLYRQIMQMQIFERLGQRQTFALIGGIALLVWITAMTALLGGVGNAVGNHSLIFGSSNKVLQNPQGSNP